MASESVPLLHDRCILGTEANIDHIAITAGGIWVIYAKRYKGRPELKIEGGILRPADREGPRRPTRLHQARRWSPEQVDLVREVVGDLPVAGALCFVEADWPLIGGAFATRGVHVLWPRRLAKLLTEPGEGVIDIAATREALASRFKSA